MHILLVADGRSPITKRWIQSLLALKYRVTLISSYPCSRIPGLDNLHILPVAFGKLGGSQIPKSTTGRGSDRAIISGARALFQAGRYYLGPLTVPAAAKELRKLAAAAKPDLVHALRIPFEGMTAAQALLPAPLIISIWGNDLTLHATGSPLMRYLTRQTLQRSSGLAADTLRDIRLGHIWGLTENRPTLVVPGNGGIDLEEIHAVGEKPPDLPIEIPVRGHIVINPRGFRPGSVRNDTFFKAIPLVLEKFPDTIFVCPAMLGQVEALAWVRRLNITENTKLLPYLSQEQLWNLFHHAAASVSPSIHDGTPNSLLEAMACGCFPIAGDIESLREWIIPGINGCLVDPSNAESLAQTIITVLDDPHLRASAAQYNAILIRERAEVNLVRARINEFYKQFL